MLKAKKIRFPGIGDSCSRSRNVMGVDHIMMSISEIAEFEKELLEAIGKLKAGNLEKILSEQENDKCKSAETKSPRKRPSTRKSVRRKGQTGTSKKGYS